MDFDDKELDKLFKNRAEDAEDEPEFEEAAWEDMERRLDKRKRRIALYYWSAAASLIFLIGLGWMMMPYLSKNQDSITNHQQIAHNPSKPHLPKTSKNNEDAYPNSTLKTRDVPQTNQVATIKNSEVTQSNNNSSASSYTRQKSKRDLVADTSNLYSNPTAERLAEKILDTHQDRNQEELVSANSNIPKSDIDIQPRAILKNDYPQPSNQSKIATSKPTPKPIQWTLGFLVGPELSTSDQPQNGLTSLSTGLTFGLKKNNFLLSLGARYGIKNYNANVNQYHKVNPLYADYVSNIKASCNILEVPLLLSYQPIHGKQSTTWINVGLSSFFMLREQYIYQYYPSSGIADHYVTKINQNQHYFKVLNLSISQNFKIHNRPFILGIEPYAKLPLAGVGYGAVKLKSYGINLNFWYDFKKKH